MYHKAMGLDPGFALALVQISKCYEMLYWWKLDPNEEGTKEKAQTYLDKALSLNPELPEAHMIRASQLYHFDRKYEEALMLVQRLLQLAPENAYVHRVQLYLTAAWQPDRATEILGVSETPSSPTYYYAQYLLAIARQDYAPLDELVQKYAPLRQLRGFAAVIQGVQVK